MTENQEKTSEMLSNDAAMYLGLYFAKLRDEGRTKDEIKTVVYDVIGALEYFVQVLDNGD